MEPVIAYLGLGSNLGERENNLAQAVGLLARRQGKSNSLELKPSPEDGVVEVLQASSVYETEPWGDTNQPHYLNCVLEIRTAIPPIELLKLVKELEKEIGRQPGPRFGPRLIDLDILFYGDLAINLPELRIPHPRIAQRAFVLVPLAELNGNLTPANHGLAVEELAETVEGREGVKLWGPPLRLQP